MASFRLLFHLQKWKRLIVAFLHHSLLVQMPFVVEFLDHLTPAQSPSCCSPPIAVLKSLPPSNRDLSTTRAPSLSGASANEMAVFISQNCHQRRDDDDSPRSQTTCRTLFRHLMPQSFLEFSGPTSPWNIFNIFVANELCALTLDGKLDAASTIEGLIDSAQSECDLLAEEMAQIGRGAAAQPSTGTGERLVMRATEIPFITASLVDGIAFLHALQSATAGENPLHGKLETLCHLKADADRLARLHSPDSWHYI